MNNKQFYLLCIGILLLFFLIIRYIFGFDGLFGQDPYSYLEYSNELVDLISNGSGSVDQNLISFKQSILYPLFGSFISLITFNTGFALQFISSMAVAFTAIFIYKTLILLNDPKNAKLYIFMFFVLSPYVLRSGAIIMSDAMAMAMATLLVFYTFSYLNNFKRLNLLKIIIIAVLCILTRYASAAIVIPVTFIVLYFTIKERKNIKELIILGLIFLLTFLFFKDVVVSTFINILNHDAITLWSPKHFFDRSFSGINGVLSNTLPNILYAFKNFFHPGFIIIGPILLLYYIFNIRNIQINKLIFGVVVVYAMFLAGIPYQNPRFLLLTFPLVIVLMYPVFESMLYKFGFIQKYYFLGIVVLLGVQLILFPVVFRKINARYQLESMITKGMKQYEKETLYSFDIDISLKGRGLDFEYINIWENEIKNYKTNSLLLISLNHSTIKWQRQTPVINWHYLENNYELVRENKFSKEWILYRIKNKK